jgi:hypothetical protein
VKGEGRMCPTLDLSCEENTVRPGNETWWLDSRRLTPESAKKRRRDEV